MFILLQRFVKQGYYLVLERTINVVIVSRGIALSTYFKLTFQEGQLFHSCFVSWVRFDQNVFLEMQKEKQRDRGEERERGDRERKTDRQTDRQAGRQTDRDRERQRERGGGGGGGGEREREQCTEVGLHTLRTSLVTIS